MCLRPTMSVGQDHIPHYLTLCITSKYWPMPRNTSRTSIYNLHSGFLKMDDVNSPLSLRGRTPPNYIKLFHWASQFYLHLTASAFGGKIPASATKWNSRKRSEKNLKKYILWQSQDFEYTIETYTHLYSIFQTIIVLKIYVNASLNQVSK